MMLQVERRAQDSQAADQHREDEEEDEEQKVLARQQIKRMMNKMQAMQRKHEQEQQSTATKSCGAINANRWLHMAGHQQQSEDIAPTTHQRHPQAAEDSTAAAATTTASTNESHELIKRRFFEKLERRKSIGNSAASNPSPLLMRNFTSKLSNLREENEYAYGFCSAPAASTTGCEIVVDERPINNNNNSSHADDDNSGNKPDYMNSELFVCDYSRHQQISLISPLSAKDITTCSVKNDNALTVSEPPQVDEKEEAVYLTLEDWRADTKKNATQVNEHNKEQSSDLLRSSSDQQQRGPTAAESGGSQMMAPIEQKQIKPLDCENNKPQPFNAAEPTADMHSDYKHPIPVGQQQVSSVAQVLALTSEQQQQQQQQQRRANERGADLVILPEKSVNNNIHQQRPTKLPTTTGMRKNSSAHSSMMIIRQAGAQKDGAGRSSATTRRSRRTSSRYNLRTCERRSCSSSSESSSSSSLSCSASSSSSSALTSSPSPSSCSSSSLDERVPVVLRLEQLSLSEDDLKSLISHSESCRCRDCSRRQARKLASGRCFSSSPFDDDDEVDSAAAAAATKVDTKQQQKDTDSSNSSSGNSSATRSLMNSLFRRRDGSGSQRKTQIVRSSRNSRLDSSSKSSTSAAKSVPNLIVNSHPSAQSRVSASASDSSGKFWSLFAGGGGGSSIGPSHASTRTRKQTSDGRDSSAANNNNNQIYSQWQPKTAGYRLHLPVAEPQAADSQTYAAPANKHYHHSCSHRNHKHHSHGHGHHHHHDSRHHRHRHHHRHQHQHHGRDHLRRSSQTSRRAHLPSSAENRSLGEEVGQVWGQLIEINKLDGSQVVELEREPGKSWGFFVARGAINKTKGIFISRIQQQTGGQLKAGVPAGLLGVGDRLLSIDEHQIGQDYDISRVNRLISKKNKILLKVKPFKG